MEIFFQTVWKNHSLFYVHKLCNNMLRDKSNLRSFSVCRENKLRTFDTNVAKKSTHFVRKVFARKILPTGKLGLFRPLLPPYNTSDTLVTGMLVSIYWYL